ASDIDRDLARQVTVRDGDGDLGDVAHLRRQVVRHRIHVAREILPGAGDTRHFRLAAELAFGADLTRDARHLRGETVELVHHRVDRVLQLRDFTAHIDGDFARQVAARDGGGDLRDVAHLAGQVVRHR